MKEHPASIFLYEEIEKSIRMRHTDCLHGSHEVHCDPLFAIDNNKGIPGRVRPSQSFSGLLFNVRKKDTKNKLNV
jgi:hypothetical protein